MTTCILQRATKSRLMMSIGDKSVTISGTEAQGFARLIELEGNAQKAFDRLMALSMDFPWRAMHRLGNRIMRRRIITEAKLGPLYLRRDGLGKLQAYRQHEGKCSTSFVGAPHEWEQSDEAKQATFEQRVLVSEERLQVLLAMEGRHA